MPLLIKGVVPCHSCIKMSVCKNTIKVQELINNVNNLVDKQECSVKACVTCLEYFENKPVVK